MLSSGSLLWLLKLANKQLLDEVFVISRIIKVEVGVISRSRRLRQITRANNPYRFFTDGKQKESREDDMITLRNHALRSYMT